MCASALVQGEWRKWIYDWLRRAFTCGNAAGGKGSKVTYGSWTENGWGTWAQQPSAMQLECAGCCQCPVGAVHQCALLFPTSAACWPSFPLWFCICKAVEKHLLLQLWMCCFAAVARLERCACEMVPAGSQSKLLLEVLCPDFVGSRSTAEGSVLKEYVCIYFFSSVSLERQTPAWVLCVLLNKLAIRCGRTCITCGICDGSWGVYWFLCPVLLFISLGVRITTAVPRAPDFFLLSFNLLEQPNRHSFLENGEVVWKNQHVLRSVSPK